MTINPHTLRSTGAESGEPALRQTEGGSLAARRRAEVEDDVNSDQFDNRTQSRNMERLGAAHRILTGRDIDASQQDVHVQRRLMQSGSRSQLQDRQAEGTAWMREMTERYRVPGDDTTLRRLQTDMRGG